MSMAPSIRNHPGSAVLLACVLLLAALPLSARQGDRDQPIEVTADHFEASRDHGRTVLTGNVRIIQGSLEAVAASAVAHSNAAGKVERIVLTGDPARLQQRMDDGSLMQARAAEIDYQVNGDTIILSKQAHVEQPGRGTFSGAHLVYHPSTGAIQGRSNGPGRVHLTLEPRQQDDG